MNKTAIKNFAVRARRKLIEDITQKVYELGITENEIKEIETFEGGFRVHSVANGKTYKKYEIKQREKLIEKINRSGYEQVIEEVAYTWFNRFIALRFMEVNEYLPTGIRVLSSKETGKTEPDIIKEALNVELDVDKDLVYRLIDENDTEDLYKYLLVKQCNELGKIMPKVFEEISDYTELLLPDNLLAEGSVIRDLVYSIEEEDYKDQVEIIGWMYQYYISEKKDEVFADLKKNKKIAKENIPAATQLFTPKWIVKYMVENSLGRLWLESHPDENLKAQWKYYLEEAEQDPEVQKQLNELKNAILTPVNIKVLDPSMGSGHILVYAFDVLYDIYLKANYSEREIPQLILEKNIYGLDIDDRAGQLAAFALMMKARSKNKRIFKKKIELNICSIQESNVISKEAIDYFINKRDEDLDKSNLRKDVEYLIEIFHNAKEYGSILDVREIDFDAIERIIEEIKIENTGDLFEYQYKEIILDRLPLLVKQGMIMSKKYDVVCTNPPYMGQNGMNATLKDYLDKNFEVTKSDLFSVFIEKGFKYSNNNGFNAMVTMQSWMFLSSFEKMREEIIMNKSVITMTHMANMVMGIAFGTAATIFRNMNNIKYRGIYSFIDTDDINNLNEPKNFPMINNRYNVSDLEGFYNLPGMPIAYWISDEVKGIFKVNKPLNHIAQPKQGLATGDNERFLKYWHEVNIYKIGFGCESRTIAEKSRKKWFPCNKGGAFRKWYGNNEYVVNWENDGFEIRNFKDSNGKLRSRPQNMQFYFMHGLTWSTLSSKALSVRYSPKGFLFETKGSVCFFNDNNYLKYSLGYLNSKLANDFINVISPTMDFHEGPIGKLPIIPQRNYVVEKLVEENINLSKYDWDSFETSWDFKYHPLLIYSVIKNEFQVKKLELAFDKWNEFTNKQFAQLKSNEEELNRIFIDIYGLQDELTTEVDDKDITIRKADRERDIKSLLSYAVGCMFGRYSLDDDGLIHAGGEFDINRYKKFIPTTDNVLVIADDEYFEDDIVNRFVEFIKITFGEELSEENLDFVAETLGQKTGETSRQTIRRYFLKDFYNGHVKTYQNRPIYWQFDSGKQNGFKALIYMHRYDSSTVARVRIDYLHKLQKKYEAELKRLDLLLETDLSPRDAAAVKKKIDNISKQIQECLSYDQVIAHIANQKIEIDLDDGVAVNYEKFQNVEVPQGEAKKPIKANLLAKL